DLVDQAVAAKRRERDPAQYVERVAEQEQPDARNGPGGALPEQQAGEQDGDEREVSLRPESPAREAAGGRALARFPDRDEFDRAADQNRDRPEEQHAARAAERKSRGGQERRGGENQRPGGPGPKRLQVGLRRGEESLANRFEVVALGSRFGASEQRIVFGSHRPRART